MYANRRHTRDLPFLHLYIDFSACIKVCSRSHINSVPKAIGCCCSIVYFQSIVWVEFFISFKLSASAAVFTNCKPIWRNVVCKLECATVAPRFLMNRQFFLFFSFNWYMYSLILPWSHTQFTHTRGLPTQFRTYMLSVCCCVYFIEWHIYSIVLIIIIHSFRINLFCLTVAFIQSFILPFSFCFARFVFCCPCF